MKVGLLANAKSKSCLSQELTALHPVFTAVRFFDNVAYAVTFQRMDPFYVIDLTNPIPKIFGELNVTGFAEYLHPINAENTLILGLGQEADANGTVVGLQISLFNAADRLHPKLIDRYVFENNQNSWSGSTAEWDPQAFRYLPIDSERGRLIIPLSTWKADGSYFDGFVVLAVTPTSIDYLFNISHVQNTEQCFYCAYLSDRSFVINGDVITLKGRSARSHNLTSGEEVWAVDFSWHSDMCCNWF